MKKILCLLAMAMMLFSSCLKNEEPTSITTLREAKAALITADAAYRTAEAALKQAEVEFQNALTAEQVLLNELQALKNEAQAIQNEMDKCDLEIKKAEAEAEKAKWAAKKAQYEKELLGYQQEMEEMIEQHKIDMLDLMEKLARAEKDYEDALKLLEAEKLHLTPEQQAIVNKYIAAIKALRYGGSYVDMAGVNQMVTESLSDLREDLIEANANLQNAQFNWNHEERLALAALDSIAAQTLLDETKKAREDFIAFAEDTDIKEWEAKAKEIEGTVRDALDTMHVVYDAADALEKELDGIDDQLKAVLVQAGYIANNPNILTPDVAPDPEADPIIVQSEKYVAEQSRIALKDSLDDAMTENENTPRYLEVEVPDALQHVYVRDVLIPSGFYLVFTEAEIEKDPETMLYHMSEGKVSVANKLFSYTSDPVGVAKSFLISNYTSLRNRTYGLIYDGDDFVKNTELLAQLKGDYATGTKKAYDVARKHWNEILPALTTGIANYKLGQQYDAQDALKDAHTAYLKKVADLAAQTPPATPTEADKQAYLDSYTKYLNLREPLDGEYHTVVIDGKDVRLATVLKAADWGTKFLDTDLENVRNAADLTMDSGTLGVGYMDEDFKDEGILPKWRELSEVLWGLSKLRVSVDTELGADFNVIVNPDNSVEVALLGDVKRIFQKLGYNLTTSTVTDDQFTVNELAGTLWWTYISENALIQNLDATLNNQEGLRKIVADLEAKIENYEAEYAELEKDIEDYLLADKGIEENIEAIIEKYEAFVEENQAPLLERKVKLADEILQLQIAMAKLEAEFDAVDELHKHYMTLINTYYSLFAESVNNPANTDELQKTIANIIDNYDRNIIQYSEDLNAVIQVYRALLRGTDSDSVVYKQELQRLGAEVEEIEAKIALRLEKIDYFQTLLDQTLETLVGTDEA